MDADRNVPSDRASSKRWGRTLLRPTYSGRAAALLLVLCLVFAGAVVLPFLTWMPLWLRLELVLAVWWLGWVIALTTLLYRDALVDDDVSFAPPRSWFGGLGRSRKSTAKSSSDGSTAGDVVSGISDIGYIGEAGEGCGYAILVVLVLILTVGAFWLLIELVIPLLFVAAFAPLRALLALVAHDDHGCEGNLRRALLYGSFWATVYVAPLAGAVWLGHYLRSS